MCAMGTGSPGWYDDGHGAVRWWDGAAWTEHVAADARLHAAPTSTAVVDRAGSAPTAIAAPEGWLEDQLARVDVGVPQPVDSAADAPSARPGRSRRVAVIVGAAAIGVAFVVVVSVASAMSVIGPFASEPASQNDPLEAEVAVRDDVDRFHASLLENDCGEFFATTTAEFRQKLDATDCAGFGLLADRADAAVDPVFVVGDVIVGGDVATAAVAQSFVSSIDPQGNPTEQPVGYVDHLEYRVIASDGGWVIAGRGLVPDAPPAQDWGSPDQTAAVAVVDLFNHAWVTGDCSAYLATTLDSYREAIDIEDCSSFGEASLEFRTGLYEYTVTVRRADTLGATIFVTTTEDSVSLYDEHGNPTVLTHEYELRYKYSVVYADGAWVINDVVEL